MPIIVPVEENQEKIAGLTDARFKAADYGGSGLAALGAGLTRLGEGGTQFATALDEKRKREFAAAKLDDEHQRNIDDAAVKRAYVDYGDQAHEALRGGNGLFKKWGVEAHAAFPDLVGKLVDNHDKVLGALDEVQRAAIAPVLGDRLRSDVKQAANRVREQGKVEQEWQAEKLLQATTRDAVSSVGDPELHDHHMSTGENNIRQQGRIKNLSNNEIDQKIADYKSAVHVATIDALLPRDPVQAAGWCARNGKNLNDIDKQRVEAKLAGATTGELVDPAGTSARDILGPATLASLRAAAEVESERDGSSAREAVSPPESILPPGIRSDTDSQDVSRALLRPQLLSALEREASIEAHRNPTAAPPAQKARPSRAAARPAHRPVPSEVPKVQIGVRHVGPGRQPAGATVTIAPPSGLPTEKPAVTKSSPSPLAEAMQRLGRDKSYDHAFWGEFRPTPNDEDDFALIGRPDPNYRPPPKARWGSISARFADQKMQEDALELLALGAFTGMDEGAILEYFGMSKRWSIAPLGLLEPAIALGREAFKKRLWNTYFNMAYITLRHGGQVSVDNDRTNLGPD